MCSLFFLFFWTVSLISAFLSFSFSHSLSYFILFFYVMWIQITRHIILYRLMIRIQTIIFLVRTDLVSFYVYCHFNLHSFVSKILCVKIDKVYMFSIRKLINEFVEVWCDWLLYCEKYQTFIPLSPYKPTFQ